ncbi:MAG: YfhO family protein [Ignavibacteria bacterium]|nr:YfhO family protein [Ignavibacteria bacterium]
MAKPQSSSNKTQGKTSPLKKDVSRSYTIDFIPAKWQTPVFLGVILILILIFFNAGLFGGKVFSSADNVASGSFKTFLDDAKAKGEFPLWVPYIFNGMPSFAALVPHLERTYDLSHAVWVYSRDAVYMLFSGNDVWAIVLFYIIFAFSFYFLAEYKFKDKLIALYAALAAVFITPIIQMIIVGHNSKMIAVMMFPAVLLMLEKMYDMIAQGKLKENIFKILLYFGVLVFFIHVQMSSNHVQMLFYFFSGIGIYMVYRLVYNLVNKIDFKPALIVLTVFVVGVGLSAMMYADSYMSSREYNKYSIRGVPPITQAPGEQKVSGAADYEYSTNWSFSPVEVMTFFVPYWVGFGDVEVKGQKANTYWGQMPFTTSPMYFGVITILLAFIGIYYNFKKSALVQAMVVISFLSLLLSFGRTWPLLYDILFYNLPYFSSFRAPVMIHILINVAFVILAGFGIKSIIEIAKDKAKTTGFLNSAKFIFPILALPVLLSLIGFQDYYNSQVASSPLIQKLTQQGAAPQQIQQYVGQISQIAYDNVKSELLIVGVLLLASFGMIYLFVKGNVKYQVFMLSIILVTIIDLWHIDFKTLHWDNKTNMEAYFKTPDYVDWIIKNEKDLNSFRVLHLEKGQPVRENTLAYWRLQNIYGYQGAKLRIYQDMDDVVGMTNPAAWRLMSTKYIITDQPYEDSMFTTVFKGSKYILKNNNYYPKVFFVNETKTASGIDILNTIKTGMVNPQETAFLEKDPGTKIDAADSTATANITGYDIHKVTIDAEASGNNLLFVSEVYYPDWKVYIDGQPAEILKTNYLFRGVVVPKGKHKIEFKFEPETYYAGKNISMGTNILLVAILGIAVGGMYFRRKKAQENEEKTEK